MQQECACGCGTVINKGQWAPGHDHRAIHSRIAMHHGNVAAFIDWYDKVYAKTGGKVPQTRTRRVAAR